MADLPAAAGVGPFGLVAALLLTGAACGYSPYLLRRLPWLGVERAKTWATAGALALAALGAGSAVAVAVSHLTACGRGESCVRRTVVAALPAPAAGAPGLDLTLRMDGLAALFVAVAGFCAAGIAVYSFGWLREDPLRDSVAGSFNLFLAATLLVVLVNNVFWLFVALELVTLCSADLVRYRGRSRGPLAASRTAIRTYLLVSHIGLMCLVAGLLPVVVGRSTLDFDVLRTAGASAVPGLSFGLVLLGLAVRCGAVPFHFWVPTVHPQMPTNTHAMMSAVMLKLPVYLMIRIFFEGVIGPVTWWWGVVVLLLAGATALVSVFYAVLSKDLKTALAYHSVENIGIILAGIGLALLFGDDRFAAFPTLRGAAALALLAALYHVVNHALFKTLLFLGTGSIERQTGTVEMGALGGLLRRSPWTGVTFLVGAAAIAGLPPLNGFISEWLTLQSVFGGQEIYRTRAAVALVALGALAVTLIALVMAVALTALAFVKIAGESLLGEPRAAVRGRPGTWSMRTVLVLLAGVCLLLGLQPWLLVGWLSAAAPPGYDVSVLHATPAALSVRLGAGSGQALGYTAVLHMLPLVVLAVLPVLLTVALRVAGWTRRPVWAGGEPFEPAVMQYTGTAVSALVWEPIGGERAAPAEAPLPVTFRMSPRRGVIELTNRLVNGLVAGVTTASQRIGDRFQNGDVRSYLLYIFGAVVFVLAVLTVSR
jgi:hydrogenase-4 component B